MLSHKNNIIISFIFIVLLGALILYQSISIIFDPESVEKGYILANQTNVFVKYSPSFFLGYTGVVFMAYPFLVVKNFMSLGENYLIVNERMKAKMKIVVYTLFSPAILCFILSILFARNIHNRYLLLSITLVGVIYVFAKNTYICLKKHNKIT